MPNQPKTPVRSHRIPDEEYLPAVAKGKAEGLTSGTAVMRMLIRKYVTGALAVACFVGGGYLASGYLHPAQTAPVTTTVDQTKIWNDLQQRADQLRRDMQQQGPAAPTPSPTTHDNTERSV
jgi:apolipoprotein N-acyltransferase